MTSCLCRYFKYLPPAATGLYIAELQFVGMQVSSVTDGQCPVAVVFTPGATSPFATDAATVKTTASKFTYVRPSPRGQGGVNGCVGRARFPLKE